MIGTNHLPRKRPWIGRHYATVEEKIAVEILSREQVGELLAVAKDILVELREIRAALPTPVQRPAAPVDSGDVCYRIDFDRRFFRKREEVQAWLEDYGYDLDPETNILHETDGGWTFEPLPVIRSKDRDPGEKIVQGSLLGVAFYLHTVKS